jgi:hypothetical protein
MEWVGNEIARERENGKVGMRANVDSEETGGPGSVGP